MFVSLKAIEKAIVGSILGMTPNNDGEVIRLTLPQLNKGGRYSLLALIPLHVILSFYAIGP